MPNYQKSIFANGLTIYDLIEQGDPELWIPSSELEIILNSELKNVSLRGFPLRTRSKFVKTKICECLGYPVPSIFKKTKPRFPGQNFDTYIQKSNNLQIWNEELDPIRRYVIIKVSPEYIIEAIKVVTGEQLAFLDRTGTLTQKYQARLITKDETSELITPMDTALLYKFLKKDFSFKISLYPTDFPTAESIIPIDIIYDKLKCLIGFSFDDPGHDQERNRGTILHKMICHKLGYAQYKDDGRFPDICNQLLEVKLQMSPTIDLGLVLPSDSAPLDIPKINDIQIRHCDVRYALFYASLQDKKVKLTHFFLTTGELFFSRFPQFQGKVLNKKLQIPLPRDFFIT